MRLTVVSSVDPAPGEKLPYYEVGGVRYPSVTTILSVLSKPALGQWAANEAAEAALRYAQEVWDRKSRIDLSKLREWKRSHTAAKNVAADIGTWTHGLMDSVLAEARHRVPYPGPQDGTEKRLRGAAAGARRELRLRTFQAGRMVFSEANGYAGTFDVIASVKGLPVLLDYKTSSAVYDEHHLQTAAYLAAVAKPPSKIRRGILRLDKRSGVWELVYAPRPLLEDLEVFMAAKRLYDWRTRDAAWRR